MITIKDIAKETGLGLATISKYINGGSVRKENKVAIDAAISKFNYTVNRFAQGLKTGNSHTIGIIIPELSNIFITTIITAMSDILRKEGYGVIVCDCRTDEAQERNAVTFLMEMMVDGIINMPVSKEGTHLFPALERNIPVVLLDRMVHDFKDRVNAVLVDNVSASASGVNILINAGHKDIGIILGPKDIFTSQQRLLGYNQALIQNSLQPDDSRIIFSDYSIQGGYESIKRLLSETDITAVFATNYEMTLGAIIAINEQGIRIPEQISFVGFDNMQLSHVIQPKLTVISQPLMEIGEHAAAILLSKFADNSNSTDTKIVTLSTEIIAGDSVRDITEKNDEHAIFAIEHIKQNYMNPNLTTVSMSSILSVSSSYFSSIFKNYTGDTFVSYLQKYRIDKSCELLLMTDMFNYEISTAVGYDNPGYFRRVFKKHVGMTPYEFRLTKKKRMNNKSPYQRR